MKREIMTQTFALRKFVLVMLLSGVSAPAVSATGLADVFKMAENNDATLAQAKAQFEADQQALRISRAPLLPQVSAGASLSQQDSSLDGGDLTQQQLSLKVNQSLYQRENLLRYKQASYQVETARFTFKNAQQDLITRVVDAYFKVLIAQQDVALAKTKELADKTQWEKAKTSARVGLSSRTDVLQAKSSYDLSKSDRISSQSNLDVAIEELTKLTGKPVSDLKGLRLTTQLPPFEVNMQTWLDRALQGNYELLTAKAKTSIAQKEVEVQKSAHFWPQVGLSATYADNQYSGTKNPAYQDNSALTLGVSVSVPLYAGGAVMANIDKARASYAAAQQGTRGVKEQIALQTRVLVHNIERGQTLVAALREAVKSNDAFLEAAEEGYKVGTKSLLEVLSARTNRFKARRDLADALHQLVVNELKLQSTAGALTPEVLQKYDALLTEVTPLD
jgi:outer membrane protein